MMMLVWMMPTQLGEESKCGQTQIWHPVPEFFVGLMTFLFINQHAETMRKPAFPYATTESYNC